jgi:hypothetical protein
MADKKENANGGAVKKLTSNSDSVNKLLNQVNQLTNGGLDRREEIQRDSESIANSIQNLSNTLNTSNGSGLMTLLNQSLFNASNSGKASKTPVTGSGKNVNPMDAAAKDELMNSSLVQGIFQEEEDRITNYGCFKQIYNLIPQVASSIDAYAENVISPEDFTSSNISVTYETTDSSLKEKIERDIKSIMSEFKINDNLQQEVKDMLVTGDKFYMVSPLQREINAVFATEAVTPLVTSYLTSEAGEIEYLNRELKSDPDHVEITQGDIDSYVSSTFKYGNEATLFNDDIDSEIKFLQGLPAAENTTAFNFDGIPHLKRRLRDNTENSKKRGKKEVEVVMRGSFFRTLPSANVVKITSSVNPKICYGYLFLETVSNGDSLKTSGNAIDVQKRITNSIFADSLTGVNDMRSSKSKFFEQAILKRVSNMLNADFLQKNEDFKEIILDLARNRKNLDKSINVVFIPAEHVVHMCDMDNDGYGKGIMSSVLLTCKIYLAVLFSTLMQQISRGKENRVFYIEEGLDKDIPGSIQNLVATIKKKQVSLESFNQISSVIRLVGSFNDLFIPTKDGNKPIEIDTMPAQDVSIDNEFLEYLRKAILSGIGIPPSFIGYMEEVEFAKSLTMQNGRFTRSVVHQQGIVEKAQRELIYKMLLNLGYNDLSDTTTDNNISIDNIKVKLPTPSTLNASNLSEKISTIKELSDSIIETILDSNDEDFNKVSVPLRREIFKEYLPSLNYDKYTAAAEKIRRDNKAAELAKASASDAATDDVTY